MEVLAVGSQPWDVDLDLSCANYAEWCWRCFRRDAPTAQSSPDADPDGDGLPNALEYAFNTSPLHPDALGLFGLLSAGPEPNATYPALKFKRRSDTSDLSYVVQVSTNLASWSGSRADPQTTEIHAMPLGDGMEEVTVRTLSPLSDNSAYYLRLTVILGPAAAPTKPVNY